MSRIAIYAQLDHLQVRVGSDPRFVQWVGDLDWPGAPRPGDTWFHCGEWAGETFWRVGWNGPCGDDEPGVTVEVKTSPDVLRHLLDEHGFTA